MSFIVRNNGWHLEKQISTSLQSYEADLTRKRQTNKVKFIPNTILRYDEIYLSSINMLFAFRSSGHLSVSIRKQK